MTDKKNSYYIYNKNKYGEIIIMGLQVNNGDLLQNSILSGLYSKAQTYTSNFLNTDTRDFADYLKSNFDTIDKNADNTLSKSEIAAQTARDTKNEELKKILENNSVEKLSENIDTDKDGNITYKETNPDGNVPDILKGALREIQTTQNFGLAAQNLAQNLCKNYYASSAMTKLATSAVSYLM